MKLLIKPLMSRPRPATRLYPGLERWIFDVFEVNDLPRKMTRTPKIMKRISFPKILLLIHHQVGPNLFWHSLRRTKTIVFAKKDPNNKVKARILLPLASTPPPSRRIKTRIRTRKTYPTLSATLISKNVIMPTNVP